MADQSAASEGRGISYTSPSELATRYECSDELEANLAAIAPISDAVIEKANE